MTPDRIRRCAAEVAVGLLICGGITWFLVLPAEERLAQAQAESARAGQTPESHPTLTAPQLKQFTDNAARLAQTVRDQSKLAETETELFGRLMHLADRTGIRIEQLEPGAVTRAAIGGPTQPGTLPNSDGTTSASSANAAGGAPSAAKDGAVAYQLTITATYERLQSFLAELREDVGFVIVRSVRVSPANTAGGKLKDVRASEGPELTAHVITEHFWFDVSQLEKAVALPQAAAPAPEGP